MTNKSKPKVLFSFFSPESDLSNIEQFNKRGSNYLFHYYFFEKQHFNKHIILCTQEYSSKSNTLITLLNQHFNHQFEIEVLPNLSEELIKNVSILRRSLEQTFEKYASNYQLFFLFNPGFGLVKYVIHELEKKYAITILFLDYHPQKSEKPILSVINDTEFLNQAEKISHDEETLIPEILQPIYHKAQIIASTNESVVITGETGTGKELLARFIVRNSHRKDKPYEAINCSAFRPELLESRLFGHKKGSFTDATEDRKGLFEENNGGTIFLDEIGDIDPYMQQLLLRFLQFKEIQPIGKKSKKVDVRIIAATNKNLYHEVQQGHFRSDLFYRFGIFLHLPPFRSYPEKDKIKVIEHFLKIKCLELGKKQILKLEEDVWNFLLNYHFPGNYRELITIIKHLYLFAENDKAKLKDMPEFVFHTPQNLNNSPTFTSIVPLDEMIKQYCQQALKYYHNNLSQTARALQISLNTLKKYLQ